MVTAAAAPDRYTEDAVSPNGQGARAAQENGCHPFVGNAGKLPAGFARNFVLNEAQVFPQGTAKTAEPLGCAV